MKKKGIQIEFLANKTKLITLYNICSRSCSVDAYKTEAFKTHSHSLLIPIGQLINSSIGT